MNNVRLGRRLGIGTRLAAKALREQAQKVASADGAHSSAPAAGQRREVEQNPAPAGSRPVGKQKVVPGNVVRNATRGGRGFGRGFWGAFAHAGRSLWYEVTGVFFVLFALFFVQGLWRLRGAWRSGPEHRHFEICVALSVLFIYFSISAFVRARRIPRSR